MKKREKPETWFAAWASEIDGAVKKQMMERYGSDWSCHADAAKLYAGISRAIKKWVKWAALTYTRSSRSSS